MKKMVVIAAVALPFWASSAWAACEYNGIYYQAGTQICFDGWLQECTVADYWSAVGMCRAPDRPVPRVDGRSLADGLFAVALDGVREPEPPRSVIVR